MENKNIYIPVILVVALVLSMIVTLDYRRSSAILHISLMENQRLLAQEVGTAIDAMITKSKETAIVYAQMPLVSELLSHNVAQEKWGKSEIVAIIQASIIHRKDISNILIFDAKGDVFLSATGRHFNVASMSYFKKVLQGESTISSITSTTTGERLLFYITPIYTKEKIVGASYISFDMASIKEIFDTFLTQSKGYKVRIVSQDGSILLSSTPTENATMNIAGIQSALVLNEPPDVPVQFDDHGPRIGLWNPIKGTPWKLLISLDRNMAMAPLTYLLQASIAVNVVAGLMMLGVMLFLLNKLVKRVRDTEASSRSALVKAKEELELLVAQRTQSLNEQNTTLSLQRQSLARMLETCPVGISVSTPSGELLYANNELKVIFKAEVAVNVDRFYSNPKDREHIGSMLGQRSLVRNMETAMLDATGKKLYILVSASLIHYEGQEAELRWFFNVTAERKANITLKREQSLLRSVLDTIPDCVFYKSLQGEYLSVNAAFLDFMGKSPSEILGKTDEELFAHSPETYTACLQGDTRALRERRTVRLEERAVSASGSEILFETARTACFDAQGEPVGILGISRDITQRKRMELEIIQAREDAQAANKAKSDFLANMSHEIRTPMNGIMGFAYIVLKNPLLHPELKDYIAKIDTSAKSLLRIINDILDFSKIEAEKLEIEHIPFDLNEMLINSIQPIIPIIEGKNIELLFDFAKDIPTFLVGDPTRLGQVILNLVSNAAKFTEKGYIVIRVEPLSLFPMEARLQFTISDTGVGIDEAYLTKLFNAFTQADTSISRRYGGTGLGLTISKALISLMGGDITVKSTRGQGTSFIFTLCFGLAAPSTQEAVGGELTKEYVLVVDDHELSRRIIRSYLQTYGARVDEADSGQKALELFTAARKNGTTYTAVLTDWRMPGMDGLELAAQLRKLSVGRPLPIIMVTAYDREPIQAQAKAMGIACILTKPVTPSLLRDALLQALQSSKQPAVQPDDPLPIVPPQVYSGPLKDKKVLLAEDNEINQLIAVELLSHYGMEVTVASNGREAVEKAVAQPFDIILMDIQMPEMDGLEAAARLRANGTLDATPIIAMTAHAMAGDQERSLRAGMQAHITKPIDPEELHAALLHWAQCQSWSNSPDSTVE